MTKTERDKVIALSLLHIPEVGFGAKLINGLRWRLDNEPTAPLSRKEKWLLELCCWHYRKALGGNVGFELPATKPLQTDYIPVRPQPQSRLL